MLQARPVVTEVALSVGLLVCSRVCLSARDTGEPAKTRLRLGCGLVGPKEPRIRLNSESPRKGGYFERHPRGYSQKDRTWRCGLSLVLYGNLFPYYYTEVVNVSLYFEL